MARVPLSRMPTAWELAAIFLCWTTAATAADGRAELTLGGGAIGLQAQSALAPSSDAPFAAVATAWQEAWNRHDMEALAEVVAEDVDFITIGGRWLKGREAFKKHHARVHTAPVFSEASMEIRATHVQRLSPEVALMHVEHGGSGDRNPDGTPRAPRGDGIFTWIVKQSSDGRWRVRASCNTVLGALPKTITAQPLYALTPQAQAAPTNSADAPLVAVATAWKDAWNRRDIEALGGVVSEDVDFVSVGVPWLKGRDAFKKQVGQLHTALFDEVEFRATHVQRLVPEVVLMHVEWTAPGDRQAGGTTGPRSRNGIFTWIVTPSRGEWRVRASTNTVITLPQAQAQ